MCSNICSSEILTKAGVRLYWYETRRVRGVKNRSHLENEYCYISRLCIYPTGLELTQHTFVDCILDDDLVSDTVAPIALLYAMDRM